MTKVQWRVLPTKANQDMEQAGAEAARDYMERTGHNNLWVIYEAMAAAAPEPPMLPVEEDPVIWSSLKPTTPGAYWIRGNGLSRPALIEVIPDCGELRCNLHDKTTCDNFDFGYGIDQLSDQFEFRGPLYIPARATGPLHEQAEFKAAALSQRAFKIDADTLAAAQWAWQARGALERRR